MSKTEIVSSLNQLLADYSVLYQKLRGYHWNVTGPQFFTLHQQFEVLYLATAVRVDDLAERVLTLGGHPHGTMQEMLSNARLEEQPVSHANDMVANIVADYDRLDGWLKALSAVAGDAHDTGTVSLVDELTTVQQKEAWMLRAFLDA